MIEFTKGEWKLDEDNKHVMREITTDKPIAVIIGEPDTERQANARLIAAAPEMYETLADIVKELRAYGYHVREDLYSLMTEAEEILTHVDGSEGLKSCPFCGGKAEIFEGNGFWVGCENSCVETAAYKFRDDAIEVWNRRANNE